MFMLIGASPPQDTFPLKVAADHRHLQDASGQPFLIQGDTAWSLIAELKRSDAERYLTDRRQRGFNAILVNLLEHEFSSDPPRNAYGEPPFETDPFGSLNQAYFDHAAWVIRQAQDLGIVVFLAPAYLGINGGNQGWFGEASTAGAEKMRLYGSAIARRFSGLHNIVWVLGGDFDAPDQSLISQLAAGITSVSPSAMITVHASRDTDPATAATDQTWLTLNSVYTYGDVHASVLARRGQTRMPLIFLEGAYENERETTTRTIRRNAYGALLAGAAGNFFGNNPVWHFSGPGIFPSDQNWQQALSSPGAKSITVLKALFDKLPWSRLVPDSGAITQSQNVYAAALPDKELIILYGVAGAFHLNRRTVPNGYAALWADPVTGQLLTSPSPRIAGNILTYSPPVTPEISDLHDWLLLIGKTEWLQFLQKR
jgi:hypothetical protein